VNNDAGLFMVIDGCSGCGKTTFQDYLANFYSKQGFEVLTTKQPSSRFQPDNENKKQGEELFQLLLQDREWHVQNAINPALEAGKFIICDRYIPSSLVYQQIDGLNEEYIWQKNQHFPTPDLTIFLNVSNQTLRERLKQRGKLTRFEEEEFRKNEILCYKKAASWLIKKGWQVLELEAESQPLTTLAILVNKCVDKRLCQMKLNSLAEDYH
jgi:dTMP kinase